MMIDKGMQVSAVWMGKNVLITGINGFIGGNLAKALTNNGANVFGLVRNKRCGTFLHHEKLVDRITLVDGELEDKDLLTRVISEEQITTVYHLAAQVEVGIGLLNPYLTYETNVRGTYCLLEAIRQNSKAIEAVVVASTDKAYGSYPSEKMPYQEDYPLIPKYPYDVSKACADMIAQSYATEVYGLPIVVTRFCNIYGPGQLNFSALLPDSIRACLGYGSFMPRGNGMQIRDFIYIDDVVDLYLIIAWKLAADKRRYAGNIYNAGTNTPIRIRDALKTVYRLTGRDFNFKDVLKQMEGRITVGEIDCQYMDFRKVNEHFGWAPSHAFEEGVEKTVEWFRGYLAAKYGR
jgi:CDP-glucose 4,6-dehydratase